MWYILVLVRRLSRYIVAEFFGPFLFAFVVITLVLIVDFIPDVVKLVVKKKLDNKYMIVTCLSYGTDPSEASKIVNAIMTKFKSDILPSLSSFADGSDQYKKFTKFLEKELFGSTQGTTL